MVYAGDLIARELRARWHNFPPTTNCYSECREHGCRQMIQLPRRLESMFESAGLVDWRPNCCTSTSVRRVSHCSEHLASLLRMAKGRQCDRRFGLSDSAVSSRQRLRTPANNKRRECSVEMRNIACLLVTYFTCVSLHHPSTSSASQLQQIRGRGFVLHPRYSSIE